MASTNDFSMPSEAILNMVHGELTSKRRWFYRWMLLVNGVILAAILSLWITEPKPLPTRLHVAFALMVCLAAGWICVFSWILVRKNCPTAIDRLATAWMATIGSSLFLVTGVATSLLRGNTASAIWLGLIGFILTGGAVLLLRNAYRLRSELRSKLAELNG